MVAVMLSVVDERCALLIGSCVILFVQMYSRDAMQAVWKQVRSGAASITPQTLRNVERAIESGVPKESQGKRRGLAIRSMG